MNIFDKDNIESIDDVISDLTGIFYGAASVFFYIKNSLTEDYTKIELHPFYAYITVS